MASAKCASQTRRFSFSVGVISPSSAEKSRGRSAKRLMCSTGPRVALTWSIAVWTSAHAVLVGGARDRLRVGVDERGEMRAAVAHHERVRDVGRRLQGRLEVERRDVLAARGHDQLLLAVDDRDEAVRVHRPDVAGEEPPVVGQRLGRRLRPAVVPLEDRLAADLDLAVVRERDLEPGERGPDGARSPRGSGPRTRRRTR